MKEKKFLLKTILFLLSLIFLGWGSVGHRIINRSTTLSFPSELNFLLFWADSLAAHASDADIRRSWDPNEGIKHYIDIDNYPDFISTGRINHNFDSLIMQYGYTFVMNQGILPWAIIKTVDSLQTAFQQGNWNKAMLLAADLGHYVADCHMPLHLTRNYNGQYSGQSGVHSRYESTMINTYQSQIFYNGENITYISNISDFTFAMVYANYRYVDSVLQADIASKNFAGGNYNSTYYQKLWELTKGFTIKLFKNASVNLAALIYTAWKNAGEPVITNIDSDFELISDFKLEQNYPNPYNPSTRIRFTISSLNTEPVLCVLKIFDLLGNETVELVNDYKPAGSYEIEFYASERFSSGVYLYQLKIGDNIQSRKMILLR